MDELEEKLMEKLSLLKSAIKYNYGEESQDFTQSVSDPNQEIQKYIERKTLSNTLSVNPNLINGIEEDSEFVFDDSITSERDIAWESNGETSYNSSDDCTPGEWDENWTPTSTDSTKSKLHTKRKIFG